MDNDFRDRNRKSYTTMRMIYDFTMAGLILGIAVILLLGDKFGLPVIADIDKNMKYGFGGLCLFYGAFRLYRGIKHNY